jgi:hypothetical protein
MRQYLRGHCYVHLLLLIIIPPIFSLAAAMAVVAVVAVVAVTAVAVVVALPVVGAAEMEPAGAGLTANVNLLVASLLQVSSPSLEE